MFEAMNPKQKNYSVVYEVIILILLGVIIWFVLKKNPDDSNFFNKELGDAYDQIHELQKNNKHIQDSLSNQIDTIYLAKLPKIKHHYDTIYINLDTIGNDSASKLLTNTLNRYADTNFSEINNGF